MVLSVWAVNTLNQSAMGSLDDRLNSLDDGLGQGSLDDLLDGLDGPDGSYNSLDGRLQQLNCANTEPTFARCSRRRSWVDQTDSHHILEKQPSACAGASSLENGAGTPIDPAPIDPPARLEARPVDQLARRASGGSNAIEARRRSGAAVRRGSGRRESGGAIHGRRESGSGPGQGKPQAATRMRINSTSGEWLGSKLPVRTRSLASGTLGRAAHDQPAVASRFVSRWGASRRAS